MDYMKTIYILFFTIILLVPLFSLETVYGSKLILSGCYNTLVSTNPDSSEYKAWNGIIGYARLIKKSHIVTLAPDIRLIGGAMPNDFFVTITIDGGFSVNFQFGSIFLYPRVGTGISMFIADGGMGVALKLSLSGGIRFQATSDIGFFVEFGYVGFPISSIDDYPYHGMQWIVGLQLF